MQITLPTLNAGEVNAGIAMKEDDTPSHWVILLPNDKTDGNWHDAMKWATEQGGELPTRQEQSLLFANAKQGFEKNWYWSSQTHDDSSEWAWFQLFSHGTQYDTLLLSTYCRARAVRRVVIE
jgi:hypothetical protein